MSNDGVRVRGFRYELSTVNPHTGELEVEVATNRIPGLGLNFLIQAPFGDVPIISGFYCTLFTKDYVPTNLSKASDIPSIMGEFINYSELTRPEWVRGYLGNAALDNFDNKAIFTPTVDARVYGAVLVSSPTKSSPDGLALSVVRFSTYKQLYAGQEAKLVAGLTYIPANSI